MSVSASEMTWSNLRSNILSVNTYGVFMKNFSVICGLAKRSSSKNWSWLAPMML